MMKPFFQYMICVFLCLGTLTVGAKGYDPFEVDGVTITLQANNVVEARAAAMTLCQKKAFDLLLDRLIPAQDRSNVPTLSDVQVERFMRDFVIGEEKYSGSHYTITLTIRFNGTTLGAFLRQHHIPFSETLSPPIVVLPILHTSDGWFLWEDHNLLRKIWTEKDTKHSLVPFIVPKALETDDNMAPEALLATPETALVFLDRYRAKEVILMIADVADVASEGVEDPSSQTVHSVVVSLRPGNPASMIDLGQQPLSPSALESTLRAAKDRILLEINESWKKAHTTHHDRLEPVTILLMTPSLADYEPLQTIVAQATNIKKQQIVEMTKDYVKLQCWTNSTLTTLKTALRRKGLVILEQNDMLVLTLTEETEGGHSHVDAR